MTQATVDAKHEIQIPNGARVLQNQHLRVAIVPERGGKCTSLRSRRTGAEWMHPPLRPYAEAKTGGGFEQWDGGGFDECLPTVAATADAPDHGELWRRAWAVVNASASELTLSTRACGDAVALTRRASLDGAALVLDYSLVNESQQAVPLLYCAHPLLRVEQGDRITLPPEVTSVRVESSKSHAAGSQVSWPGTGDADLSVIGPPDGSQADKLFTGAMREGWCSLFRPAIQEGVAVTFSADALPYLGMWICRAAWPEGGVARQYTVAFEPASAPHDSLAAAEQDGTAWQLAPGERRHWSLRFALIDTPSEPASRNL